MVPAAISLACTVVLLFYSFQDEFPLFSFALNYRKVHPLSLRFQSDAINTGSQKSWRDYTEESFKSLDYRHSCFSTAMPLTPARNFYGCCTNNGVVWTGERTNTATAANLS